MKRIMVICLITLICIAELSGCKLAKDNESIQEKIERDAETIGAFITTEPITKEGKIYAVKKKCDPENRKMYVFEEYDGYSIFGCSVPIGKGVPDYYMDSDYYEDKFAIDVGEIDGEETELYKCSFICRLDIDEMKRKDIKCIYVNPVFMDEKEQVYMIKNDVATAINTEATDVEIKMENTAVIRGEAIDRTMHDGLEYIETKSELILMIEKVPDHIIAREYNAENELINTTDITTTDIKEKYKAKKDTEYIILSFTKEDEEIKSELLEDDGDGEFHYDCFMPHKDKLILSNEYFIFKK